MKGPLLVDQFNRPIQRANAGGYEGAMQARRLKSFVPSRSSTNTLLQRSGESLVARSHYVVRNNPYARNAKRSFKSNMIGTRITPRSKSPDKEIQERIHDLWADWVPEADADGVCDFYGMQTMVAGALWESGECFLRARPRRMSVGLSVPLQYQLIESEQLPFNKTEVRAGGNEIRSGIEFNQIGKRVAYHFLTQHPGDNHAMQRPHLFTRVPAESVIHVYEAQRIGQIRGEPQTAASMVRMFLLDQYDDAELDRKKIAALYAAFITTPQADGSEPLPGQEATDTDGITTVGLEPGTIQRLNVGESMEFSNPSEVGGSYEPFEYRNLLAIAAGMGVPYQNMTGDFSKANYSSLRAALLEFRGWMRQLQMCVIVFQLCRNVWNRWMSDAVLSGALDIPDFAANRRAHQKVKWIPCEWPWADPLKDGQAELLKLRAGFKSLVDAINERGSSIEEVFKEIKEANALADEMGIVLESDPRRVTRAGVGQFSDPLEHGQEDDEDADKAGNNENTEVA